MRGRVWEGYSSHGNSMLPCCSFLSSTKDLTCSGNSSDYAGVGGTLAGLYLGGLHPCQDVDCCACLLGGVELHILFDVLNILWQQKVKISSSSLISKAMDQSSGYFKSSRFQINSDSSKIDES